MHQPEIRPLDKTDLSSEETGVGRELWGGTVAEVRLPPLVDGDPPHAPALGGKAIDFKYIPDSLACLNMVKLDLKHSNNNGGSGHR